ncbi:MAG: hypothetical protein K9L30_03075 [Desulfobacterales bacterium]|nr:hypothetical protein [Desulfobacterales bacterium]
MKKYISIINNNQGIVFVASVMLLGVLLILGTTGYLMTTGEHHVARNYATSKMSYYDASAGVHFGRFLIEKGLSDSTLALPDDTTPTVNFPTHTVPSGYNFILGPIIKLVGGNFYQYTVTGYSHAGALSAYASSTTKLTVKFRRIPQKAYAAFAYENYTGVNDMGIYAYSHNAGPHPFGNPYDGTVSSDSFTAAYQTYRDAKVGLAGVGSNELVYLNNKTIIDGFVYLGQIAGVDASFTDLGTPGAQYYGVEYINEEIPRDPKGIASANFEDPWDPNDNIAGVDTYDEMCDYIKSQANDGADNEIRILDSSYSEIANDAILDPTTKMKNNTTLDSTYDYHDGEIYVLHSQGTSGGFYYFDTFENEFMDNSIIVIDGYDGDVNIVIDDGDFDLKKGNLQIINDNGHAVNIYLRGDNSTFTTTDNCEYIYEDLDLHGTSGFPEYTNPLNFKINSNSTDDDETIYAGTSGHFIGSIYAPYTDVHIHTQGDLYGAIWADEIKMGNSAAHFFPVELGEDELTQDIKFVSWKDDRFVDY